MIATTVGAQARRLVGRFGRRGYGCLNPVCGLYTKPKHATHFQSYSTRAPSEQGASGSRAQKLSDVDHVLKGDFGGEEQGSVFTSEKVATKKTKKTTTKSKKSRKKSASGASDDAVEGHGGLQAREEVFEDGSPRLWSGKRKKTKKKSRARARPIEGYGDDITLDDVMVQLRAVRSELAKLRPSEDSRHFNLRNVMEQVHDVKDGISKLVRSHELTLQAVENLENQLQKSTDEQHSSSKNPATGDHRRRESSEFGNRGAPKASDHRRRESPESGSRSAFGASEYRKPPMPDHEERRGSYTQVPKKPLGKPGATKKWYEKDVDDVPESDSVTFDRDNRRDPNPEASSPPRDVKPKPEQRSRQEVNDPTQRRVLVKFDQQDYRASEDTVRDLFSLYGEIQAVETRGKLAVVTYSSVSEANAAVKEMNNADHNGTPVMVSRFFKSD